MLSCQRAHFDMPRDVAYFNAAAWSPLPISVQEAAREAVARKGQPWKVAPAFANEMHERARSAAARLINADASDVALISSVGYGVATAAKLLKIPRGSRVLTIEDDHSSPVLEWMGRAGPEGYTIETVKRPADSDWTAAILEAIDRKGVAPVSLASISSVHWSDGGLVDLDRIAPALKRLGAVLLVDATHSAGMIATDVRTLDPDVLIFPTYKWLLGPYGRAFLYVAKRHREGVPLEQTAHGRRAVLAESPVYFADTRYRDDARRFDMGERDHFISMEMAAMGIELIERLGQAAILERLAHLTGLIEEGLAGAPLKLPARRTRAPHLLCLGFPNGMPEHVIGALAAEQIYVAPRLGRIRISPHVYNDVEDVERLVGAMRRLLKR